VAPDYSNFVDALRRLMGLHNLSGTRAAPLLGMSPQHLALLMNGKRNPTYERLRAIGDLFGIQTDRLVDAPWDDLLQHEIADPQRFHATEQRIQERQQRIQEREQALRQAQEQDGE
jgi:transcriptional regulator with XRE-family HTH domain